MSPERAHTIIPTDAILSAECRPNTFGGAWIIWARQSNNDERPVTIFSARDPFGAAHWLADFDRLRYEQSRKWPGGNQL